MNPFTIVPIKGTEEVCLGEDKNLTPEALKHGTILLEHAVANLEIVKNLGPRDLVLDCGFFIGDTGLIFAKNGAKVHGFEPCFDAYCCALINTRNHDNIHVYNIAIGDEEHVLFDNTTLDNAGNLGTRSLKQGEGGFQSVRLDSMQRKWKSRITFIKLDCEGMEFAAMQGGRETILKYKPALLIELFPDMLAKHDATIHDIYRLLTQWSYEWKVVIGAETDRRWDILATPKP